jgi:RNase H-like domain found in reverse transcriptase
MPEAQAAFEHLKILFTEAPILCHYDPDLPVFLYTDASGFATSAILCQKHNSQLHPIAFWSHKSNPAECNYDIHNRKMLAIVLALGHWSHYCKGAKHTITIITDHKNFEVFMSTKILNRCQARWAELLPGYNFVLVYTPGSTNPTDRPSHHPDYTIAVPQASGSLLAPSVFQSYPLPDLPHSA